MFKFIKELITLKFIKRWITLKFIKNNMGHKNSKDRNLIFNTINSSLATEFAEENFPTLFFSILVWMLKNNHDFVKNSTIGGIDFLNQMESMVVQAVSMAYQDTVYKD